MRILSFVKRICFQMLRDKRTLALMMVAPLFILTLLHVLFNSSTVNPLLGITGGNEALVKQLKDFDITVKEYTQVDDAKKTIINDNLDGLLQSNDNKMTVTFENSDPNTSHSLQMKIQQALAAKQQAMSPTKMQQPEINTAYIYGNKDTSFFDMLSPAFVGFFVFFFVFLIAGIALLRERTTGTLDRLMATPTRRGEVVAGYLLGYGIFAVIQTVIVVLYAIKVLGMMLVGSLWLVILINLLLALVALSLGILLSAFANSEFQMMQFIPIVILPQIFFSGIFPIEGMANWLQVIAKCMPMYYGADALKGVMVKGFTLYDIRYDLLILLVFALVFITLNIFALRKYRKI
ncbi:ABC transporter permease [Microbacteriaceae bacterium 4G12]